MKGGKYKKLEDHLRTFGKDTETLTFSEIEGILGVPLPDSAYKYYPVWQSYISKAWRAAGYSTERISIKDGTVTLRRDGAVPPARPSYRVHKGSLLSPEEAVTLIRSYFNTAAGDAHARYLSWRHCYRVFGELRHASDDQTVDYLALHLGFYLASWGMYRGSSFLLQKDYKIHIPVVRLLQDERYDPLRGISAAELCREENLCLLEELANRVVACYETDSGNGDKINHVTDTLLTKILLGTLGCVPAYDTYYCNSVKKLQISSGRFDRQSVRCIAGYYLDHEELFERLRQELSANADGIEYPPMKLMDMCFWEYWLEHDEAQRRQDHAD